VSRIELVPRIYTATEPLVPFLHSRPETMRKGLKAPFNEDLRRDVGVGRRCHDG